MGAEPNAYLAAARALLERLESQTEAVEAASRICADAIGGGGLVHCFGTGHSRIPVEELFPRYGSYPGFAPLVELSMTFHTQVVGANGQRQAMAIERVEGFAATILANFRLRPTDAAIVFSAGGTTAVPIEMAMGFRAAGLRVIAVTSVEHSRAARVAALLGHAPARPRRRRARPVHAARRRARRGGRRRASARARRSPPSRSRTR